MNITRRTQRVADLITREVAAIVQREVKDPRIGLITFTGADVSPDLRSAKILYTVLGDEKQRGDSQAGLERARGFIRRELSHRLTTKVTPDIKFVFDPSLDRAMRLEELLHHPDDGYDNTSGNGSETDEPAEGGAG